MWIRDTDIGNETYIVWLLTAVLTTEISVVGIARAVAVFNPGQCCDGIRRQVKLAI